MADEAETTLTPVSLKGVRFLLPTNYILDGVSEEVKLVFARAVARLKSLGATVVEMELPLLNQAGTINPKGTLVAVEGYNAHRKYLESSVDQYDPPVAKRIKPGAAIAGINYVQTLKNVAEFGCGMAKALEGFAGMISPTVIDIAPPIALVTENEDEYYRFNGRMLRNCSVAILIDGCGISVPCNGAVRRSGQRLLF